jgi:hypothetical protein
MTPRLSTRRKLALGVAFGLLVVAQMNGGSSYNLGVPQVPGTHTPESNPATAVPAPQGAAGGPAASPGSAGTAAGAAATAPPTGTASGPAYSFGAAPAPVISPGR